MKSLESATIVATALVLACDSANEPSAPSFPTLAITSDALPGGIEAFPYSGFVEATGGEIPLVWSLVSGSLPAGLTLTTNGDVTGTPMSPGSNTVLIRVDSRDGQASDTMLSIGVVPSLQPHELCLDYPGEAVVTFADSQLAARVASNANVSQVWQVTCGGLSAITVLGASTFVGPSEPFPPGISSLLGIQNLSSLTEAWFRLSLTANVDLTPLASLTSLERLVASQIRGGTTSLGPLSGITSLKHLEFDFNEPADIAPLAGLTSLTTLRLAYNQIADITPLAGLTNLTNLDLEGNEITDITPLAGLTSLASLDLDHNALTDIQPLLDNVGIGAGDNLSLDDTGANCSQVAALRARGVAVYNRDCP